jgi:hypothetical protein
MHISFSPNHPVAFAAPVPGSMLGWNRRLVVVFIVAPPLTWLLLVTARRGFAIRPLRLRHHQKRLQGTSIPPASHD